MKVLFVSRRYWPAIGGVESLLRDVARGLATRHDVTVLVQRIDDGPSDRLSESGLRPPPSFDPFQDDGVRVEPLRLSPSRRALLAPLAAQAVPVLRRYAWGRMRLPMAALYARATSPVIARAARDADVIHMWGPGLLAAAAGRAARRLRVPFVVTAIIHPGEWGDDRASVVVYRTADRVVALLETDAGVYRALGVPADRVAIAGACSPGVVAGGGDALRARYGIAGPLILFLGARRPNKGVELLLEAARLVTGTDPDATFAFVGPGDRLVPLDGSTRVIDRGLVDNEERAAWLDAADVLCLPSSAESFGLCVLEAWSVATPVVTSDIPTLRELVGRSQGGIVTAREPHALAAAFVSLLRDPELRARLGARGREYWRDHFTVEAVVAKHERIYESVVHAERVG